MINELCNNVLNREIIIIMTHGKNKTGASFRCIITDYDIYDNHITLHTNNNELIELEGFFEKSEDFDIDYVIIDEDFEISLTIL